MDWYLKWPLHGSPNFCILIFYDLIMHDVTENGYACEDVENADRILGSIINFLKSGKCNLIQ